MAPPVLLAAYLAAICTLGFVALIYVLTSTQWTAIADELLWWPVMFLAVAAIAGEVKPLVVTSRSEERTLSTSAPFVLALIVVAGVGVAIVVQIIASLSDDVLHRRQLKKSLFNTAQYALSVLSGAATYSWLAGVPIFGSPLGVEPGDILPLMVGGIVMVAVNWVLVAVVVTLASGQTLWTVLRGDFREFLVTNAVLLCVGGIAAIVTGDGVGALVLLAAPVLAAHLFAAASARHAHDATHDALTGLGNRGQANYELGGALQNARQSDSDGPGFVFLDLDHFKDFNDALGHPVGDRILCKVAERLVDAAPENSSVHRLGGDEFAVVVRGGVDESEQVARDLVASLDAPIKVDDLELLVRVSAGVAAAPMHGTDVETLMKNSDIALYRAKVERDQISVYSPEFDVNSAERLQLLVDLRTALDSRQLEVVYQPQFNLADRRMVGVEALVRWNHPTRGTVYPDEFIPLAESSGLIFPLTAFVLDEALGQLARWRASGHFLRMAVNLSARHLSDLALPDRVAEVAERHGVSLGSLVLEVTETGILSDPVRADLVIRALRERGVAIAIDDYGTGNASLSYLKRLEIDELKVDRSFVSNIGDDHQDLVIVRSTIALALALGLRVVAEGIEDESTAVALQELGRVVGQGYHLGRPTTPDVIEAVLDAERQASASHKTAGY
ncbi:putative bifunctional diguanylate cyclase/phosphodiesterase [Demequina aurantiaca]|uniref:putative bifunctional diguanylate cyclase/phosphodiesterase n=1 Tax=Demequina aurantiaca TaxID=676200 RepID=UPI000A99796A|nr:bifunctional diguanylate cyclase/phosphodiesterase [Demequina aurantiaca]